VKIHIAGAGNMGGALAAGLLRSGLIQPRQLSVADVRPEALAPFRRKFRVRAGSDNRTLAADSHVVLLCVKPQQMAAVLSEFSGRAQDRRLFISIAAGISTRFVEKGLGAAPAVVRVMPNTPALLGAGALVYCLGRHARPGHEATARRILSAVGRVWKTTESRMDAVTALSGSGPAYVFYLAECLAAAGRDAGLPATLAEELARHTVVGAGLMLRDRPEKPDVLRQKVTSPGGTTAAALSVLERHGVRRIFSRAVSAARRRARELSAPGA
jgi:pyrroline-5-carboxylate reductase